MLPKPLHEYGYTEGQIEEICKERNITMEQFWEAFGINTCMRDEKLGTIYYPCDIEKALYMLRKKDGKFHEWD